MSADEQVAQQDPAQRVVIFDTTLRDGEQSPGIHLNTREKVEIAHQLARLRVDVIEAGFPIASPGDFEATRAVGPDRTVWATDLGQVANPPVEDGLALMADSFLADGFTEDEIRTMAVTNTRRLAGLAPLPERPSAVAPEGS